METSTSWWRSALDYFWLYLVSGACFVPAGLIYGVATVYHWHQWPVICVSMASAFVGALFVWRSMEQRLVREGSPVTVSQPSTLLTSTLSTWDVYDPNENTMALGRYQIVRLYSHRRDEIVSINTAPEGNTLGTANVIDLPAAA